MGLDPAKIEYLQLASARGATAIGQIDQRGEDPSALRRDFKVIQEFQHLRLA